MIREDMKKLAAMINAEEEEYARGVKYRKYRKKRKMIRIYQNSAMLVQGKLTGIKYTLCSAYQELVQLISHFKASKSK